MDQAHEALEIDRADERLERWGLILVSTSLVSLLLYAFVPLAEFVHRGDDAFYYFEVARNFPRYGFWTFDGVHGTNGVQPLWALVLTALAFPLHWLGLSDPVAARVFVAVAVLCHFATGILLYRLLVRTVSVGTALAAAGGLLFPLAIVYTHVWGMENALYGAFLIGTVSFYHLRFLPRPDTRTAVLLGLLLGLTALSRLNSGTLVAFMGIAYLLSGPRAELGARVRRGVVVSLGVAAIVVPYVAWNLATTGDILPVSGAVKSVLTESWMAERELETRLSWDFVSAVYWDWRIRIQYFIVSRGLDGLWALGARVLFKDATTTPFTLATTIRVYTGAVALLLIAPFLLGDARGWLVHLRERARRLGRFWYVGAFAVFNSALSVLVYPSQAYAILRWWLAECEILVVVVTATVVAASVGYMGRRLLSDTARFRLSVGAVSLLVLYHGTEMVRVYWGDERQVYDWNPSWNDHSYGAAEWMNANLPEGSVVGSWNAGVVGYYSRHTLVNLDGLINNHDLLPYIREGRVAEYIRSEGIQYLSDLEPMFERTGVLEELRLETVYTSRTEWGEEYRVYRVVD